MRKKSQDELGTLVTREMKVMLQDESLTKEQRFDVLAAVMFDTPIKNAILGSFAKSLKAGFEQINGSRFKAIDRIREFKKRSERIRRHGADMDNNRLPYNSIPIYGNPLPSIPIHGELKAKARNNISPYKPPKGGVGKSNETSSDAGEERKQRARNASLTYDAAQLAYDISQTEAFAHMRVNDRSLRRHLIPLVEKNSARLDEWRREVMDGLAAWTEWWKSEDWKYAPGKITKWLADEKYLEPPRKKQAAEVEVDPNCGNQTYEII